jgi:hypothetical protein
MQSNLESSPTISFDTDIELKKLGVIVKTGWISPELLSLAETNCRSIDITDSEKAEMDISISNCGVVDPVVINENNEVVKGQLRWSSALRTQQERIPYIMIKFADKLAEMLISFMDALSHPLNELDKCIFVHKWKNLGKDYEEIAAAVGKDVATVRGWANSTVVPDVIKGDTELMKKFNEMPLNKKMATKTILNQPQYKGEGNEEAALEVANLCMELPIRDLEETRKAAMTQTTINVKSRQKRLKNAHGIIRVKVAKDLYDKFKEKAKKLNKDPDDVVIELIIEFVNSS